MIVVLAKLFCFHDNAREIVMFCEISDRLLECSMDSFMASIELPVIYRTIQKMHAARFEFFTAIHAKLGAVVSLDDVRFAVFDE